MQQELPARNGDIEVNDDDDDDDGDDILQMDRDAGHTYDRELIPHYQLTPRNGPSTRLRCIVGGILLAIIVLVVADSFGDRKVESSILAFLEWVEDHPLQGMLAVICVYIAATILFIPGSVLTFGTGYAFGAACDSKVEAVLLASSAVFIGASLGSICTFLLGRYLFRDCVYQLASSYPLFQAIDRALHQNGLKIMILLRLSPLIPYNALDYMSGITAISLWAYCLALIGILPGTVMLCFIGASASSLADHDAATNNKTLQIVTIVLGITFAAGGVYVASYYSKRELEKILIEEAAGGTVSLPLRENEGPEAQPQEVVAHYRDLEHPSGYP